MKPVTRKGYERAVRTLIVLAQNETSGGRVAAQVVLSAYNGGEWQLDVTDLALLDRKHYLAALNVIRGRNELGIEPHEVIPEGQKVFNRIWNKWRCYHVAHRWNYAGNGSR